MFIINTKLPTFQCAAQTDLGLRSRTFSLKINKLHTFSEITQFIEFIENLGILRLLSYVPLLTVEYIYSAMYMF